MSDYQNNERKPELDLTILKAYLESLRREADLFPGYSGMKFSLGKLAEELAEANINEERKKEVVAELSLYDRTLRERLEREAREREKKEMGEDYDSPFDKVGKTFTGEMQL